MPAALPAGNPPPLAAGEVHVWSLDLSGAWAPEHERDLAQAELERAARFAFDTHRHRFLHGRHAMRTLLGRYLGIAPANVPLLASEQGKPFLEARHALGFNLTHAGDFGLLAVGRAPEIGIDIEEMRPQENLRALARSVFSDAELASLAEVADGELAIPFYTTWTRKEAYLKALGTGLTLEPRTVHVGTRPGRERFAAAGRGDGSFVEVEGLACDRRCVAALAVVGGFSAARIC